MNPVYRWRKWDTKRLSNFLEIVKVGSHRARLPLLVTVEQTRMDNLAAHIPAHRVHFMGEIHEDSSSNMSTILSLLLVLCSMPCDPAKARITPSLVVLALAVEFAWLIKALPLSSNMIKSERRWNLDFHFCFFTSPLMSGGNFLYVSGFRGPTSLVVWVQIDQFKHSHIAGFQGTFWKDSA